MNLTEIEEIKRKMEFNKTESEIITKLVNTANIKGAKFEKENKKIYKTAKRFLEEIDDKEKIIFSEEDIEKTDFSNCRAVGIDGSLFPIGGVGGKWYIPYAIVRILYENGIHEQPIVDIYDSNIDELDEKDYNNIKTEASHRMLLRETTALEDWVNKKKKSIIFIDGPVIDPPSWKANDYVKNRCNVLKKGIANSLIIGCVKQSRDQFFIREFENIPNLKVKLDNFPSDQHLFAYLFSLYREAGHDGFLFSKAIFPKDSTFDFYKKHGVTVFSFFFQKRIDSKILRLDIPLTDDKIENSDIICKKAAMAASDWQYPQQYIPVPVELAHQKCTINEGTAEVLYDEIITRAHNSSVNNQLIINQLR